jgi:restriction endonuclease Mrr
MPMPTINDLLPPFFELLSDGQPHTHQEIAQTLASRFQLSAAELNEVTEKGVSRFQNLIAWCKAYSTMAGFTRQAGKDGLQLSPLGLDNIKHGTKHISVKYLKSRGS